MNLLNRTEVAAGKKRLCKRIVIVAKVFVSVTVISILFKYTGYLKNSFILDITAFKHKNAPKEVPFRIIIFFPTPWGFLSYLNSFLVIFFGIRCFY